MAQTTQPVDEAVKCQLDTATDPGTQWSDRCRHDDDAETLHVRRNATRQPDIPPGSAAIVDEQRDSGQVRTTEHPGTSEESLKCQTELTDGPT